MTNVLKLAVFVLLALRSLTVSTALAASLKTGLYAANHEEMSLSITLNADGSGFFEGETQNSLEWKQTGSELVLRIYAEEGSEEFETHKAIMLDQASFDLNGLKFNFAPYPVWGARDTVFEIWQSTEFWTNHFATYQFTADSQGSIPANLEVTELKIETNHGLIEFDETFTDSTAGRYGTGNLTVDMDGRGDIKEFIITGATGKIDGKLYDLSDNIRVSDYKPLPLRLGKKIQNSGK